MEPVPEAEAAEACDPVTDFKGKAMMMVEARNEVEW